MSDWSTVPRHAPRGTRHDREPYLGHHEAAALHVGRNSFECMIAYGIRPNTRHGTQR